MIKTTIAAVSFLLASQMAFASVLELKQAGRDFKTVPVYSSATVQTPSGPLELLLAGKGLRKKAIFKVYVAQLFVSDLAKYKRTADEAAPSIDLLNGAAIQLNFLRDVDADKIKEALVESLGTNKVDLNEPSIKQLVDAFSNAAGVEGKTLVLAGYKFDSTTDRIVFEGADGKQVTIDGPTGLLRKALSIWIGTVPEAIKDLKAGLMKDPSSDD
jgi:hypothetical protein